MWRWYSPFEERHIICQSLEDNSKDYQNCSVLISGVIQLCTIIWTLVWAVLTGELLLSLGFWVHFCVLTRASLFVLGSVFLFCVFSICSLDVSNSAVDCLERLVTEVTCYVSIWTLDLTHSLIAKNYRQNVTSARFLISCTVHAATTPQ